MNDIVFTALFEVKGLTYTLFLRVVYVHQVQINSQMPKITHSSKSL